jgi:hypothetical protein
LAQHQPGRFAKKVGGIEGLPRQGVIWKMAVWHRASIQDYAAADKTG